MAATLTYLGSTISFNNVMEAAKSGDKEITFLGAGPLPASWSFSTTERRDKCLAHINKRLDAINIEDLE